MPAPDIGARRAIFDIHVSGMPLGRFERKHLLNDLEGFTGADIEAICREAALIAMRANKKTVTKGHFLRRSHVSAQRSPSTWSSTIPRWRSA